MFHYFGDYYWQDGEPKGLGKCEETASRAYRIVQDPYRKRLSVELYSEGSFQQVLYDSGVFDFRDLKPERQTAWKKEPFGEQKALIRNEHDRVILLEDYGAKDSRPGCCMICSPTGLTVAKQEIRGEGSESEIIVLLDPQRKPVFIRYLRREAGNIEAPQEQWNCHPQTIALD